VSVWIYLVFFASVGCEQKHLQLLYEGVLTSCINNDFGPKDEDIRYESNSQKKKAKANSPHKIYMYNEHLTTADDCKSLYNIFHVRKTRYLVFISITQAFNNLGDQGQGLGVLL